MKISAVPAFLLLTLPTLSLLGCGGSKGGDISGIDPKLRFVNAFPGVSFAKAASNGTVIGDAIAYGTASSYASFNNDSRNVTAGVSAYDDLAVLSSNTFANNNRYTSIGFGPAGGRRIVNLQNDRNDAPNNRVSLRLFNGLSSAASVDFYVTAASAGDSLPGTPTGEGVAYGSASDYHSVDLGSGSSSSVRIRVFAAGDRATPLEDRTLSLENSYRGTAVAIESSASAFPLVLRDNQ